MPEIMTTREVAKYLKLHQITIIKYVKEGIIPAFRVGRVWRFDKEIIDKWISEEQKNPQIVKKSKVKAAPKAVKVKLRKKKK